MRSSRAGRDEDPHHRSGGAASPNTQSGRPAPVNPVVGRRSGNMLVRGPRRSWPSGAETSSTFSQRQIAASHFSWDLALIPGGSFGPERLGRPSCDRRPE